MQFNLSAEITVSAYTAIEADSLEEAIALAESRSVVLGGVGSGADGRREWVIDDADGMPVNIGESS
jgi:hypothetical protein